LSTALDLGHDVYCYRNNDDDGHVVADAQILREAIS